MGSQVTAVLDAPEPQALETLHEVPGWFQAWEQRFSRFRPESELNRVNGQAGQPIQVSQEFAEVFEAARRAADWTGGLVTPAAHDALLAAGYRQSFQELVQDDHAQPAPVSVPGLGEIRWDRLRRILQLPPGLHLDFGGSAKGWAAEQAVKRLQRRGAALVDAGGDIAMSPRRQLLADGAGLNASSGLWPVGVARPFEAGELVAVLALRRGGVATSGRDRRRWKQAGQWQHHLIDPRTGRPAETDVLTATVIATGLLQAEAAAKCLLILGSRVGLAWLGQSPHLAALLVLETGQVVSSPNFSVFEWKDVSLENITATV
jgi:thiamine biosynthesis lipoprotein